MMKSGSPLTYFSVHYLIDVVWHFWALTCMVFIPAIFGLETGDWYKAGILWAFSDPLFNYSFIYFFVKDRRCDREAVQAFTIGCTLFGILIL